jgi:hypothetical protein
VPLPLNSKRVHRTPAAALVIGGAVALITVGGCVGPFPRRVPGSDVTLPPPTGKWLLESLIACASQVGDKSLAPARDGGTCRAATGDTIPDVRGPTAPPPTKVP